MSSDYRRMVYRKFDWVYYLSRHPEMECLLSKRDSPKAMREKLLQNLLQSQKNDKFFYHPHRTYSQEFDPTIYIIANKDLVRNGINTIFKAVKHYVEYGYREQRAITKNEYIKSDIEISEEEDMIESPKETKKQLTQIQVHRKKRLVQDERAKQLERQNQIKLQAQQRRALQKEVVVEVSPKEPIKLSNEDCKAIFRDICKTHLKYIRNMEIPDIPNESNNEALFIEFRVLPHVEFVIRNAINKLGSNWAHTVVCGKLNYGQLKQICDRISPNIRIIQLPFRNIDINTYSEILCQAKFWERLKGDKILLYQEDSLIFKSNIRRFLQYDYIGAPWATKNEMTNDLNIGNGGFSLRNRKIHIQICQNYGVRETQYNQPTLNYMKRENITYPPEDVYFSKNMIDHKIGNMPDYETAKRFSVESVYYSDPFAGHQFWKSMRKWQEHIFSRVIKQFRLQGGELGSFYHRGGWNHVLSGLNEINFFSEKSKNVFVGITEYLFLYSQEEQPPILRNWCGFIHCTDKSLPYDDVHNIKKMFARKSMKISMNKCKGLFATSEYQKRIIQKYVKKIPIEVIYHPVVFVDTLFEWNKFKNNKNKTLIQLGQQLREVSGIYRVKTDYQKLWLSGCKQSDALSKVKKEMEHFKYKFNRRGVEIKKVSVEKFDELLTKNIAMIPLFEASANNSILECIVRNTPFFVHKLPAVVEYLGQEYPLYIGNVREIDQMIKDEELIKAAHEYLKKLDKSRFRIGYFLKSVLNSRIIKSF